MKDDLCLSGIPAKIDSSECSADAGSLGRLLAGSASRGLD